MTQALMVSAVDTDAGKTFISALIVKTLNQAGLRAAYFKPAASGNPDEICADAAYVKATAGLKQSLASMCPFIYAPAVSPLLAGKMTGCPFALPAAAQALAAICADHDYIVIEGAGGLCCPLTAQPFFISDLAAAWQTPIFLCAPAGLGTLNHCLLNAHFLHTQGLALAAAALNHFNAEDFLHQDNLACLKTWLPGTPILTVPEHASGINDDTQLPLSADALTALFAPLPHPAAISTVRRQI